MSWDEVDGADADCCAPGTGCQSTRWRDRIQTRLDNTAFHHRWMANGPLWWLCPPCRSLRRTLGEIERGETVRFTDPDAAVRWLRDDHE